MGHSDSTSLASTFFLGNYLSAATSLSVIRIRIERLRAQALTNLLLTVLGEVAEDLERGVVVTVEPSRVRMRRLPLVKEG
jgi:predicted nuclease of predicted toxin-antitoxin system